MPSYRVTIRYGAPRARYEILDVDAPDLPAALIASAERLTPEVAATAELAEIRRQADPDAREYAPE
jgi:hypothetical protein